jgi:pyruvate/2-oxoglutarate dehydrogenase complex dihydrolipoamide dehydrogenase (E3) component
MAGNMGAGNKGDTGIKADICVIGAGSGGLSVAAGAVQMGASTVLIERGAMGGDCLNYGCVPSKSLLASGKAAEAVRHAGRFGVNGHEPQIDFARVHDHVHGVISAIAPNDSVERFEGLGVKVIRASARFTGPDTVEAGGTTIKARRFVLATGSRAATPAIPGLDDVSFLTNETIFERKAAPEHLIVIGGGPIGMEMAQAHRRLGVDVTVLQKGTVLPKDDPDLVAIVRDRLKAEGVDLRERVETIRVERYGNGIAVVLSDGTRVEGSDLLVAAGRHANVDGLGLEAAGIEFSPKGVKTDARLRTTNHRVFAVGDVAGGPQFTHIAGYHAGIVIRNALFRLPAKVDYSALPWVTYTDPELAHVGLTEAQARDAHKDIKVLTWGFEENDRAQTERETEGKVKVITLPNGRILGASIVGPHAGELIQVWCLAISQKLKIGAIASMIAPYPTLGEAGKRAAGAFYTPKLFSGQTRGLVRFLSWFG